MHMHTYTHFFPTGHLRIHTQACHLKMSWNTSNPPRRSLQNEVIHPHTSCLITETFQYLIHFQSLCILSFFTCFQSTFHFMCMNYGQDVSFGSQMHLYHKVALLVKSTSRLQMKFVLTLLSGKTNLLLPCTVEALSYEC